MKYPLLLVITSILLSVSISAQKCPPSFCPKCDFGHTHVKVSNGTNCLKCVCNPNPCEVTQCPIGTICQLLKEPKNGKQMQCIAKIKIGECPLINTTTSCPPKRIKTCETDDYCPAAEKCCSNGCQSICTKPCLTTKCTCLGNARVITKMNSNGCTICSCSFESQLKRDICELPKEPGQCKASLKRFYYDTLTKTCQEFTFSGCGGNENNFPMREYCIKECQVKKSDTRQVQTQQNICHLPIKIGNCRAALPRYHYDPMTQSCKQFIFSGCAGNDNNFETKELCENKCLKN